MLLQDEDKMINLDGDNIEVVVWWTDFLTCYSGKCIYSIVSMEEGAQEVVTSRITWAWRKFKEVLNVCRKSISLSDIIEG